MRWLALLLAVGCRFDPAEVQATGGPDAREWDAPAGSDAAAIPDWKPTGFDPTELEPFGSLEIAGEVRYDTSTGLLDGEVPAIGQRLLFPAGAPPLRILAIDDLTIFEGGRLQVVGSASLIVAVYGDAAMAGTIDASAGLDPVRPAPGADDCDDGAGEWGETSATGGGGGGGGGFATPGGSGGRGDDPTAMGGMGGIVEGLPVMTPLRGGCPGGRGGDGAILGSGGLGGRGGGAVQLSVLGTLTIGGTIRVVGSGGTGGLNPSLAVPSGAGGGGGSGGAILVEATSLHVLAGAAMCANGGSGGEGGDADLTGADGRLGSCSETEVAETPNVALSGGDGGRGTSRGSPSAGIGMQVTTTSAAGGGGGGGLGRIRVRQYQGAPDVDDDATVSGDMVE